MKRDDLPYFGKTIDPNGNEHYLIGAKAKATHAMSKTEVCLNARTGLEEPHLVIRIPISKFENIDYQSLANVAAEEQAEKGASCPE